MAALRLCTHIKTNGIKCGSPALRHHTLCYFHYQWQKRDQRRIRLGGPVGMNKNSGVELPLLDGPEAILVSIMEIQRGLLDHRIEVKMGTALLYSLQLALQARIPRVGLCPTEAVRECPELDMELEMERARAMRPAKEKCAACRKQDDCLSPRDCRKLPKLPAGYHREGERLVCERSQSTEKDDSSSRAESRSDVVEGPASDSSSRAEHASACVASDSSSRAEHASACVVEGPAFSPTEATALNTTPIPETGTHSLRESSPGREPGESAPPKFPPSRAEARRQIVPSEEKQKVLRLRDSRRSPQDDTSKIDAIPYANSILRFNPSPLMDLPGKFPQLVETTGGTK
ncbi:MAG: hypothetical protein ROO76_18675 [Terriglobia bacterium]|nr:hypothetical protein [Terriglobia bacterium]